MTVYRRKPGAEVSEADRIATLHNKVVFLKRQLNLSLARERAAHARAETYREQRDAAERRERFARSRARREMERENRTPITPGQYGGPEGLKKAADELYGKRT